jgi:hypothetical protein
MPDACARAPQVVISKGTAQSAFTYDHVFGPGGADPKLLFPVCVEDLVKGVFDGYNATVFSYGQTGSGKTFTMGQVVSEVVDTLFGFISASEALGFAIRATFVEIYQVNPGASALSPAARISGCHKLAPPTHLHPRLAAAHCPHRSLLLM